MCHVEGVGGLVLPTLHFRVVPQLGNLCGVGESQTLFLKQLSQYQYFARLCYYLHPAAQLYEGAHVVVYRSNCRYLAYSIHISEFMPIFFRRKRTKHENTRSPLFSYDTKMAADDY